MFTCSLGVADVISYINALKERQVGYGELFHGGGRFYMLQSH